MGSADSQGTLRKPVRGPGQVTRGGRGRRQNSRVSVIGMTRQLDHLELPLVLTAVATGSYLALALRVDSNWPISSLGSQS